jgi:hypothetical protein
MTCGIGGNKITKKIKKSSPGVANKKKVPTFAPAKPENRYTKRDTNSGAAQGGQRKNIAKRF